MEVKRQPMRRVHWVHRPQQLHRAARKNVLLLVVVSEQESAKDTKHSNFNSQSAPFSGSIFRLSSAVKLGADPWLNRTRFLRCFGRDPVRRWRTLPVAMRSHIFRGLASVIVPLEPARVQPEVPRRSHAADRAELGAGRCQRAIQDSQHLGAIVAHPSTAGQRKMGVRNCLRAMATFLIEADSIMITITIVVLLWWDRIRFWFLVGRSKIPNISGRSSRGAIREIDHLG
jgi:hypothetical protein